MRPIVSLTSDNYGFNSHDEWIEDRRTSLGGSDANTIAGNNKWASWYSLWCDKTDRIKKNKETEATWIGHVMEGEIAKRFSEDQELKVSFIKEPIRNPDFPYSHANLDGWIESTNEGLEIKTKHPNRGAEIKAAYVNNDIPAEYYAQCLHCMAVTGAAGYWLAVYVLYDDLYVFHIERTPEVEKYISILMEDERYFWEEFVLKDTPPALDGSDATKEAIDNMNPDSKSGKYIDLPENMAIYLERREALMSSINSEKEEKTKMENIIKDKMKDSELATCGKYRITWKGSDSKRRFSVKKSK